MPCEHRRRRRTHATVGDALRRTARTVIASALMVLACAAPAAASDPELRVFRRAPGPAGEAGTVRGSRPHGLSTPASPSHPLPPHGLPPQAANGHARGLPHVAATDVAANDVTTPLGVVAPSPATPRATDAPGAASPVNVQAIAVPPRVAVNAPLDALTGPRGVFVLARSSGALFVLAVAAGLFLVFESFFGGRNPRVANAPVDRREGTLEFE